MTRTVTLDLSGWQVVVLLDALELYEADHARRAYSADAYDSLSTDSITAESLRVISEGIRAACFTEEVAR